MSSAATCPLISQAIASECIALSLPLSHGAIGTQASAASICEGERLRWRDGTWGCGRPPMHAETVEPLARAPRSPNDESYSYANMAAPPSPEPPPSGPCSASVHPFGLASWQTGSTASPRPFKIRAPRCACGFGCSRCRSRYTCSQILMLEKCQR